jgi:hypothetical protein
VNSNLRVVVSLEGCFSSSSFGYLVALDGALAQVLVYGVAGRKPVVLGTVGVPKKEALAHIQKIATVFSTPEQRMEGGSTSQCEVEVGWNIQGGRELRHAKAPAFLNEMLEQLGRPERVRYWAQEVHDLSRAFLEPLFSKHEAWRAVTGT